jgi:hypothetical protein
MLKQLFARWRATVRDARVQASEVRDWRERAAAAAETGDAAAIHRLLEERDRLALRDDDTEIEVERLRARIDLFELEARLAAGDLPVLVTQHRAVAGEDCCLLTPAVWIADQGDVPGKLFLTARRLRFAGGAGVSLRWSAVAGATAQDRELLVAVGDGSARRFRCNTIGDALVAARLVAHLRTGGRSSGD